MLRSGPLFAVVLLTALAAISCQSGTSILSDQQIVFDIPWIAPEEARYRLMDGDDVKGSAILRIDVENGEVTFAQEFEGGDFRDEITTVADAETLQATSLTRVITGPDGERRWQVEYDGHKAVVLQRTEDDERRDEVAAPTGSYDSWTDLFLWRTIDFREGYEATYSDILSATLAKPQVISQTLRVTGKDEVEVPAGVFTAWRVEVRSSAGEQTAWYADRAARPLVRYDNGSQVFELLSLE